MNKIEGLKIAEAATMYAMYGHHNERTVADIRDALEVLFGDDVCKALTEKYQNPEPHDGLRLPDGPRPHPLYGWQVT